MFRPNQKMRWKAEPESAWPASNPRGAAAAEDRPTPATGQRAGGSISSKRGPASDPRGAGACGDRSAPATSPRKMRSNPHLAIDHASSRNRSALALSSERDLLQAPVSVTAPRYVIVPRGAASGSREPSRQRKSRIVSAGRRRTRLPPPRRRDIIRRQRAHQFTRTPPSAALHPLMSVDAVSVFVASPVMCVHQQKIQRR